MKDSAKYLLFSKYISKNIFVDTKNNVVIDVLDKIEDTPYPITIIIGTIE